MKAAVKVPLKAMTKTAFVAQLADRRENDKTLAPKIIENPSEKPTTKACKMEIFRKRESVQAKPGRGIVKASGGLASTWLHRSCTGILLMAPASGVC